MSRNKRALIKFAVIFSVLALLAFILWKVVVTRETIMEGLDYIRSFGIWSFVAYAALYILLVSLSFPAALFNITAGLLFSFTTGLAVALFSGLAAACLTFTISRFMLHDFICVKIKNTQKGEQLLAMFKENSAKFVIMLRLNPFIPAIVKNYGLGVTEVKFRTYAWSTLIGQMPLTTMYVYLGWIGGSAMLSEDSKPDAAHYAVLGGGLIITVVTLVFTHYYFRKKMSPAQ